jgi:hypothetical protein
MNLHYWLRLARHPRFALMVFAMAVSMLTATGRIGNADAFDQFYAAGHWVMTGRLGVDYLPGGIDERLTAEHGKPIPKRMFWPAADGKYYQSHDLGNVLVFVPAALVSKILGAGALEERLENPPEASKVAASLLFSLEAVICVLLLFSILKGLMPEQSAAKWSAAFMVCSFFMAYTRMPWDVAAGGVGGLFVMRQVLRIIRDPSGPKRNIVLLGIAAGLAATFRYSYAPFLGLAAVIAIFPLILKIPTKSHVLAVCAFAVTVLPQLIYNKVRMGSFFVPGTTAPRYSHSPELSWQTLQGMCELFIAPDLSLFLFCPTLLMLFAAWRLPKELRMLAIGIVVSTLLYMLMLGSLPHRVWSGFMGWGPRYLVPALPMLFTLAAIVTSFCSRLGQTVAVALSGLGVVVNFPMLFANWPLVQTSLGFPERTMSLTSSPIIGLWAVAPAGITTGQHQLSGFEAGPNVTLTYPDWLIVHASLSGTVGKTPSVMVGLLLVSSLIWSILAITRHPINRRAQSQIAT